jgi:hypothetical protein
MTDPLLFKTFAKYGWSDIHYANAFLPNEEPTVDLPNRWSVGIRTGPNNNYICVRQCFTIEEIKKYESPRGSSIKEATYKSIRLFEETSEGFVNNRTSCRAKKVINV